MEYSFYKLQANGFCGTLARLLDKICLSGKRSIVFCSNEERLEELDRVLWTFSTNSFIPHGGKKLGYAEDQQVFLTADIENPNKSSILLLINDFEFSLWNGFTFEKVIFAFSEDCEKKAEICLNDLKNNEQNVNYWQQTPQGWQSRC